MPRDYAKSHKGRSRRDDKPLPGWIWGAGGLCMGLFVALLVYLHYQPQRDGGADIAAMIDKLQKDTTDAAKDLASRAKDAAQETSENIKSKTREGGDGTGPRFDFYHILPELEVAIPETELMKERDKPAATQDPNAQYVLQAGSFSKFTEADKLKASLALLGLQASIQTVTVNKDTWHRVRVGPYTSLRELGKARRRLQDQGIQPMVLQL
ncbi:MAG: SPOR domain-containing protein, partial [Pseudomonadota bacterium]